jgi:arsenate reductase
MYNKLNSSFSKIALETISNHRKEILKVLINYIKEKIISDKKPLLNFICTHNSRRSQLSQIWAKTAADYYKINVGCFSGGIEITAFNERAVASLRRNGFKVKSIGEINPKYQVYYAQDSKPIIAFSKLFNDAINPSKPFAAIMTCNHADENCPFVPYSEKRISLTYNDPKAYDNTDLEVKKYDERTLQIASEMIYIFKKVKFTT